MKFLYLTLLQFTKGEGLAKVTSGRVGESFEVYRQISNKGKNGTVMNLIESVR